jgi:hypothetical protein
MATRDKTTPLQSEDLMEELILPRVSILSRLIASSLPSPRNKPSIGTDFLIKIARYSQDNLVRHKALKVEGPPGWSHGPYEEDVLIRR